MIFQYDNQIDPPERRNYLKRCFREQRWRELGRELVRPLRYRLYQVKQGAFGTRAQGGPLRFDVGLEQAPELTPDVPDVFAGAAVGTSQLELAEHLNRDVDDQLRGYYRLAGGGRYRVDLEKLDGLEDFEDHHAYHRLYWTGRYAQAAALGHPGAEDGLLKELGRWINADWSNDRRIAYAYTTSERIASLIESLFWIKHGRLSRAAVLGVPIKRVIWRDTVHLVGHIEYRLGPHNHILNNARALYLSATVLAECAEAASWRALAFKTWDEYLPQLVLPDGSFNEATSFYLLMNCRTALEYMIASRDQGRILPPGVEERLKRFLELGNELLRPDGSLPRFGNSSPDHVVEDLWGFLPAAHRLGFLQSKPRHAAITPLTIYYSGSRADNLNASRPGSQRESLYADGGWAFLKRPELGVELVIHGDPRKKTYPHGDAGRGSFELWWRGAVLIREPGNVCYGTPSRHWYRSGVGQNVTCLNGLAPGISQEYQGRLPGWYVDTQTGAWQRLPNGGFSFCAGGYERLGCPVNLERKWHWASERRLVMEEEINGKGDFSFTSRLHLGDAAWVELSAARYTFASTKHSGGVEMCLHLPPGVTLKLESSRFAPEYGVEVTGRSVALSGRVRLPIRWSASWEFAD